MSRRLRIYYYNRTITIESDSVNIDSKNLNLPYDGGDILIKKQDPDFIVIKGKSFI